jgi:hypothetical protein
LALIISTTEEAEVSASMLFFIKLAPELLLQSENEIQV